MSVDKSTSMLSRYNAVARRLILFRSLPILTRNCLAIVIALPSLVARIEATYLHLLRYKI
jgi:hypothetical protein